MAINSRTKLIEYCLRRLGSPVIDINIDGLVTNPDGTTNSTNPYTGSADSQISDRIDDALQFYQDYHYDAIQKVYVKHQITSTDITNQWIPITDAYTGVINVFPFEDTNSSTNMFNLRYQLRLNELYDFLDVEISNYVISQQHLQLLSNVFSGSHQFDFNRLVDRLHIYLDWTNDVNAGEYFIIEAYKIIDPETYTDVYNDIWLKRYATALLKRQWGENLMKYDGLTLPGGITYNGSAIYDSAITEIDALETEMQSKYEEMPQFLVG